MTASRLPRRIVCTIVRISGDDPRTTPARFELPATDRFSNPAQRLALGADRAKPRPSQLLPWADPYISKLVHRLQDEVRRERGQLPSVVTEVAELDPPGPGHDFDWDLWDQPRHSRGGDLN